MHRSIDFFRTSGDLYLGLLWGQAAKSDKEVLLACLRRRPLSIVRWDPQAVRVAEASAANEETPGVSARLPENFECRYSCLQEQ